MDIPISLTISREAAAKAEISKLIIELMLERWTIRRIAYILNVNEKTVRKWLAKESEPVYSNAIALIALHKRERFHMERADNNPHDVVKVVEIESSIPVQAD